MKTITITITDAPTLSDLAEILNGASNARIEAEGEGIDHPRVDEVFDVASLPTYGGETPDDTMGIYSWDAESVLYADGSYPRTWVVSPRDDD